MKFTVLNHIIIQNNKIDSTALSSFKQLQNSSLKVDALSKILKFWPFSDDHKNFIFKGNFDHTPFLYTSCGIFSEIRKESMGVCLLIYEKQPQKRKKLTIFPQKLMFQPFSDDHKNFIFKDRGVKFIVLDHIIIKIDKIYSDTILLFQRTKKFKSKIGRMFKMCKNI